MRLPNQIMMIFLLSILPVSSTFAAYSENPFVQRVEGKFIREAGISRLDELFRFANGWGISSIDAYTVWSSPGLLSGYDQQNWVLFVDDFQVDVRIFDNINYNYLGISADDIDYVEFSSSPDIVNGVFTDRGMVHIHTYKAGDFPGSENKSQRNHYVRTNLGYMGGNETGEPGLFKYTEEATPNVDRIGADYRASIFLKSTLDLPKLPELRIDNLAAGVKTQNPFLNDSYISRRYRMALGDHDPRAHHKNYYYRGDFSFDITGKIKAASSFFYNISENEEFLLKKSIGRELPTGYTSKSFSFQQKLDIQNLVCIKYSLLHSDNKTSPWIREGGFNYDYHYDQSYTRHALIVDGDIDRHTDFSFGLISNSWENYYFEYPLRGFIEDSRQKISFDDAFATIKYRTKKTSNNFYGKLNFYLENTGENDRLKGNLLLQQNFSHFLLALNTSYSESYPLVGKHIQTGTGIYQPDTTFYNPGGIPLTQNNSIYKTTETSTFDFVFRNIPEKSFISILDDYELKLSLSNFKNLGLDNYFYRFAETDTSFIVYYDLASVGDNYRHIKNKGTVIGISTQVGKKNIFTDKLSLKVAASYQETVSGDSLFKIIREEIFPYTVRSYLTFKPEPNLTLTATYSHYGPTEWGRWQVLDTIASPYSKKLESIKTFDIAVQKYFVKRHVMVNAQLRNIFNHVQRYHPVGGRIYDRSLLFHISFYLDRSF